MLHPLLFLLLLAGLFSLGSHAPERATRPNQDHALFFAVADYDEESGLRDLQNPIKNAEALAGILEREYGFTTEVIRNPTLIEIENKLYEYRNRYAQGRLPSEGQLFISFSGHGDMEFGEEGYFLPRDADPKLLRRTAIQYTYWRKFINSIDCQHILVAIDACHSVTFDPSWRNMGAADFERPGELSEGEKLLQAHAKAKARLFFTSDGKGDQTPDKSDFNKKLQEGLLLGGGVDGILTSSDVFAVLSRARPQPHRGEFGDDEPGSSFLFVRNRLDLSDVQAELKAWKQAKNQNTVAAYQEFLDRYPVGDFASLAEQNVQSLQQLQAQRREADAWSQAQRLNTVAAYQNFVSSFPRSGHLSEARQQIQALEAAAAQARDDAAYQQAQERNTQGAYQGYLDRFPGGRHREEAATQLKALQRAVKLEAEYRAWQKAKEANTAEAYQIYLDQYPNGNFAEPARAKLGSLTKPSGNNDLIPLPRMVKITGGTFPMGSEEGDRDEKPVHSVTVSDFYLAETEVTNEQFCVFLNVKGNQEEGGVTWLEMSEYVQIEERAGRFVPKLDMAQHPVVEVSWYGARAYCQWLSETRPGTYRLPTEAEWEYAAGGGASGRTKWAGTDQESSLRNYGNYSGTGGKDSYDNTAPVKSFEPNKLGLYDMSGNVWEWCQDWWGNGYYASSPSRNPTGPSSGVDRVLRGGSWYGSPQLLRVADRSNGYPGYRGISIGFRPARSL